MWVGLLALFLAQVFGAALPTAVKLGLGEMSPFEFSFFRFVIAILLFLPVLFLVKSKKKSLTEKQLPQILLLGLCLFANIGLYSIGILFTTVIMAQTIYVATPLIAGAISHIWLHEKLTKQHGVGMTIAALGVLFLIFQSHSKGEALTFGTPLGNVIMVLGMIGYACYIVYSRYLSKTYASTSISFSGFIGTTLWIIPFALGETFLDHTPHPHISMVGILSIFIAALVTSILFYFLIQIGIARTNAFTASIFQYLSPLFAGFVSIPLLGEKLTTSFVVGGIIIILGVFYATTLPVLMKNRRA